MSEKNANPSPNCKRDFEEASSTSISPLKKTKLDDDDLSSSDSHDVVFENPSSSSVASSTPSDSDECSVTSAGEENEQSSSISSGCFSSESKEIAKNSSTLLFVSDLEAHQISENETSTIINSNFRKETIPVSEALGETTTEMKSSSASKKTPTPAEIEELLSELEEKNDEKQKKFIDKYNFDIVNDKPLEGRYKWDRLKP